MKKFLQLIVIITVLCSCSKDAYEKGEGKYSLMRGDFAEAIVNSSKQVTGIITDDGDEFTLIAPYTAKWVTTADTTYRCMLYYNKMADKAEVLSMGQVPCVGIAPLSKFDHRLVTDPVKFESTWMSKSGRYLNLSLLLKTGVTDDSTAVQNLAIVSDTVITHPDNKRIRHLILHNELMPILFESASTPTAVRLKPSTVSVNRLCIPCSLQRSSLSGQYAVPEVRVVSRCHP